MDTNCIVKDFLWSLQNVLLQLCHKMNVEIHQHQDIYCKKNYSCQQLASDNTSGVASSSDEKWATKKSERCNHSTNCTAVQNPSQLLGTKALCVRKWSAEHSSSNHRSHATNQRLKQNAKTTNLLVYSAITCTCNHILFHNHLTFAST